MVETTVKRISFDRRTDQELTNTTLELITDDERLVDGWERVYTCVTAVDITTAPDKIRFGTGDKIRQKWHEEEPNPVPDVYYHTEREYHCREEDRGVVGVYGGTEHDILVVNWVGYDKLIGER